MHNEHPGPLSLSSFKKVRHLQFEIIYFCSDIFFLSISLLFLSRIFNKQKQFYRPVFKHIHCKIATNPAVCFINIEDIFSLNCSEHV